MNAEEFRKISAVLNLSQQKLGEKIGVNRQTISRYEKSGVKDIETVRKIKTLYDDHNMERLFGHYPSNIVQEPSTEYETSKSIDKNYQSFLQ